MTRDELGGTFVSGVFNVIHPGHIRLLNFAKSLGHPLTVGILSDDLAGDGATFSMEKRMEGLRSLRMIDRVVAIEDSVILCIKREHPKVIVKGREFASIVNDEDDVAASIGARLVFSSGDSHLAQVDLDYREEWNENSLTLTHETAAVLRGREGRLLELIALMERKSVLVIGDAIVDEYIACRPIGMSQEEPVITVSPVGSRKYIGGAAIVAAHAGMLSRDTRFASVLGEDSSGYFIQEHPDLRGVHLDFTQDQSRPTTTKQRWRVEGRSLLRVTHTRADPLDRDVEAAFVDGLVGHCSDIDLVVFADFGYGVVTRELVTRVIEAAKSTHAVVAADSQSSSHWGDLGKFKGVDLVAPTEHEARILAGNNVDGLVVVADRVREHLRSELVMVTLGRDGVLARGAPLTGRTPQTYRLPALNANPVDVAGAGDAFLVTAALAQASGATIEETALLGSLAAAIQVSREGNRPIRPSDFMNLLSP